LVLLSSSYASLCTYMVTSEFLGSDHSVVLTAVNANTSPEDHGVPKWNFSKAKWQQFSAAYDQTLSSFSISLDYGYCLFKTSVREAALEAILQSKRSLKMAFLGRCRHPLSTSLSYSSFVRRHLLSLHLFSLRIYTICMTSLSKSIQADQKPLHEPAAVHT